MDWIDGLVSDISGGPARASRGSAMSRSISAESTSGDPGWALNAAAPSGQEALGNEDRALAYVEWRLACLAVWSGVSRMGDFAQVRRSSGPRGVWRRARPRTRGCDAVRAAGEERIRSR